MGAERNRSIKRDEEQRTRERTQTEGGCAGRKPQDRQKALGLPGALDPTVQRGIGISQIIPNRRATSPEGKQGAQGWVARRGFLTATGWARPQGKG